MRKVVAVLAVVALGLLGWWLATRGESPSSRAASVGAAEGSSPVDPRAESAPPAESVTKAPRPAKHRDTRKRDAMRTRILDTMHARERAAQDEGKAGGHEPEPSRPSPGADDDAPPVGNLRDRTGNHGYLVEVLNKDLMPLVDECYELALEEDPTIEGMLAMELEILGEEEIGGVVDEVEPGTINEVEHPTLIECVRESILATTLPPPPEGGRDEIMLSMPLSPDDPS